MTDLPEVRPGARPPRGPHVVVHDDGTRQEVYGGPNYRPALTRWQRLRWQLAPATTAVIAVVWPASWGDLVGGLLIAAGLAAWVWWRGR